MKKKTTKKNKKNKINKLKPLTELSVTEAKHATVRAVYDGRDNVAEHRRCYVALNTITRAV